MQGIAALARRTAPSICSALLAVSLAASSAHAQSWVVRAPMPEARGCLTSQPVGSRIHVIGGDVLGGGATQRSTRNDIYDPATDAWSVAEPVPDDNTWCATSAVLGDKIYLIGGYPAGNLHRVYDASRDEWSYLAPPGAPGEYSYQSAAVGVGGLIYLVRSGSNGGSGAPALKSYDPLADAWTTLAAPPDALVNGRLAAAAIGNRIFVVGAGTSLAIYDVTTDDWSLGADLPFVLCAPAGVALDGKFHVFGGMRGIVLGPEEKQVFAYDPSTNTWEQLPDMPTARGYCAGAVVGPSAFVFGGIRLTGQSTIDPGPNEEWQSGLVSTELNWSDALGFESADGVAPNAGLPGQAFEFRVDYLDAGGVLPGPGYPKLRLDLNGDGTPESEHAMLAADADADVTDGKAYFYPIALADPGAGAWRYAFSAENASGNDASGAPTSWTAGPDVRDDLYQLAIFADDLLFSDATPAPGETITVTVRFDNDSLFAVSDVLVAVESEGELVFEGTLAELDAGATGELSFPFAFAQDGFYPLRAYVDFDGQYEEWNELDNNATRPLVVGEHTLPGSIELQGLPAQMTYSVGGYVGFAGTARYLGTPTEPPPPVQGGTITFRPNWTSAYTTTTDDAGRFALAFPAPAIAGTWLVDVEATDYTLTATLEVVLVPPPDPPTGPNLSVALHGSASAVCVGDAVTLTWSVTNTGNEPSPATVAELGAPGEAPLAEDVAIPSLQPGETHLLANEVVTALVVGSRGFTARVDPANAVAELAEHDNAASASFHAYPVCFEWDPDYVRFSPPPYCSGEPVTMSFFVRNFGCLDAPATAVRFRVDGILVEDQPFFALAGKGQGRWVSFTHAFAAAGAHQVSFELDASDAHAECDEANNLVSAPIQVVACTGTLDYQVDACGIAASDEEPLLGQPITFRATVRNLGSVAGAAPLAVRFLLDGAPLGPDVLTAGPLPPGGSLLVESDAGAAWPVDLSPHLLQVVLDPDGLEEESSEVNNVAARVLPYELQWMPIATCPGSGGPSVFSTCALCTGDPVSIRGFVVNKGLLRVAGPVEVAFEDGFGGAPVALGSVEVADLGARGECSPTSFREALLAGASFAAAGTHGITLRIDPGLDWPEYDETNNVLARSLSVSSCTPLPDLTIRSEHVNPEELNLDPGETLDWVVLTAFNEGAGVAPGVSADLYMDGQLLCAGLSLGTIAPGGSSSVECAMPWPAPSTPPYLHVLQALIDPANSIPESDETDNAATRSIVVGPAPDLAPKIAELRFGLTSPDSVTALIRVSNAGAAAASAELALSVLDAAGQLVLIEQIPISVEAAPGALWVPVSWSLDPSTVAVRAALTGTAPADYDATNDASERALEPGPLRSRRM